MNYTKIFQRVSLLFMLLAFISQANAKTYYVGADGSYNYTKISLALADKKVLDGDTIIVMPGDYNEQVLLETKNIVLIGSGAENTRIFYQNNDYAVKISTGKMKWFTVSSIGSGILASGGEVRNCVIRDCSDNGIFIGSTNAKIINCISYNNKSGFYKSSNGTWTPTITNCIALNNLEYGYYNDWYDFNVSYSCSYGNPKKDLRIKKIGFIEEDPMFIDIENGIYLLLDDSPCKNTGLTAYKNPDGTRSDMGYYGGDEAPTFPVVKDAKFIIDKDGNVRIEAIGISPY